MWLHFALPLSWAILSSSAQLDSKVKTKSNCAILEGIYTSVMRRIFNQGFHKELSTEIELMWTTSILPESCRLVVEETLPRGMYVDPDQLRDLRAMTGLKTYIPVAAGTVGGVDVEAPEWESEAFRVLIFRKLHIQENLRVTSVKLPVHLRYHRPAPPNPAQDSIATAGSTSSPLAIVKLQNPRLLLTCDEDDFVSQCPARAVTSYCDSTGTAKCEYLQVPYKINTNSIEVSVPVGNSDHTWHVVGLTTFVVSGGTVYLLVALFRKTEPINLHR